MNPLHQRLHGRRSVIPTLLSLLGLLLAAHTLAAAIPTIDLSGDATRQVVVAQGTDKIYQGHPTTLAMPDGKTIFCVWTLGHGGSCGPMKRSDDGGRTWSELLPTPENWMQVRNCPAIYRLTDPQGISRLFVFAGRGPDGKMQQSHSTDDGKTWTPMASNGLVCIMPFCTIAPVDDGKRLIAQTNIRRPGETKDKTSNIIAQSESTDGGLTWSEWRIVLDMGDMKPCEPEIVRSPDGKQLLSLLRENSRTLGGLFMTSNDEGHTWSETKPLPPGLHGDRYKAQYASDGRLVICFRDMGKQCPTRDHFVAWVGRYEDILAGRDGQYKVKLLHSNAGSDCGYPGLETLPDGTFVATTYVKYHPGSEKQSVVSTHFTLAETDRLSRGNPDGRQASPPAADKPAPAAAPFMDAAISLFTNRDQNFYRLPSLLVTSKGTVLAAGQKRQSRGDDFAPSSLVLRRSLDGGKTFTPEQTLFEHSGDCTFNGNLVEDRENGTIFACFIAFPQTESKTWFQKIWVPQGGGFAIVKSTDDGETWSAPIPIMPQPNAEGWHGGGALNNNHGIQLRNGPHAGRLVIGARVFKPDVFEGRGKGGLIYSDDHGVTWHVGGVMLKDYGDVNSELTVGQTTDGEVYVNSRNEASKTVARTKQAGEAVNLPSGIVQHQRIYSRSRDGGESFYEEGCHAELFDGPCNAGQTWVPLSDDGYGVLLFTAPAVSQRSHLTGYVSRDGGRTWAAGNVISEKSGGYSDCAATGDKTILTLYENARDDDHPRGLLLARYNLGWLLARKAAEQ